MPKNEVKPHPNLDLPFVSCAILQHSLKMLHEWSGLAYKKSVQTCQKSFEKIDPASGVQNSWQLNKEETTGV